MNHLSKLLLIATLVSPACALAATHVHGKGRLDIAVDGAELTISMELPLDSLTGFEHAPRTPAQRATLSATLKQLQDAAALFVPSAAARCSLKSVQVADPFSSKDTQPGHADIDAEYVFSCAGSAELKAVEVRLFKYFERLRSLDFQRATPTGQAGGSLRSGQNVVRW
jgi:hypothetical protein